MTNLGRALATAITYLETPHQERSLEYDLRVLGDVMSCLKDCSEEERAAVVAGLTPQADITTFSSFESARTAIKA